MRQTNWRGSYPSTLSRPSVSKEFEEAIRRRAEEINRGTDRWLTFAMWFFPMTVSATIVVFIVWLLWKAHQ